MEKVVVTGGAGFIGSHLADALVERGFATHVVDNLSAGRRENVHPKAVLHEVDIRERAKLAPIFNGARYVFHAAAIPQVQTSIDDPHLTHDVNVTGTHNVLAAARDAGVEKVVFSASSAAYGDHETLPFHEGLASRPLSPYGLHKFMGEEMARLFSRIYGLKTVSLRYFNVYGERAPVAGPYSLVIGRFLDQRAQGQPLTIVPDGTQSRDYVHVSDVVRANLLAAASERVGAGETINIGSGKNYSVLEIASLVGGPTVSIEPRIEPKHSRADVGRARELLGWEPLKKFEEGIAELKTARNLA